MLRHQRGGDGRLLVVPKPGERIADFLRSAVPRCDRSDDELRVSKTDANAIRQSLSLEKAGFAECRFQFSRLALLHNDSALPTYSRLT
jgi:hypothetical protein